MYIYTYIHMCICVYIYIYTYEWCNNDIESHSSGVTDAELGREILYTTTTSWK